MPSSRTSRPNWSGCNREIQVSTLGAALATLAHRHPDRLAIIEVGGRSVSFAALEAEARAAAALFYDAGVRRGESVALWLPNRVEWISAFFGAARLGAVAVALNPRFRQVELSQLLSVAPPTAVLIEQGFAGVDFAGIARGAAPGPAVLFNAGGPATGTASFVPEVSVASACVASTGRDPATPGPHDLCAAFTTSGTTGFSKLAAHDQAGVLRHCAAVARGFGMEPGTVVLVPIPLCGVFGFASALATLLAGGTVVLQKAFDASQAAAAMDLHRVAQMHAPDTVIDGVLDQVEAGAELPAWRRSVFADFTGIGERLVTRAARLQPGLFLSGVYGSSEGLALMATWNPDDPPELSRRAGGRLVGPEMEVQVVDPETGDPAGSNRTGELRFRGPNLFRRYLGDATATRSAFTPDGWYRSGDLGELVEERAFVFLARVGDSLRLRGFMVDPAEIERHLLSHPGVRAAQVVGVFRPGVGDTPVAFVIPQQEPAPTETELLQHCRSGIAAYKVPARILLVGEFPVTHGPNGTKIQKMVLRRRAEAVLGQPE